MPTKKPKTQRKPGQGGKRVQGWAMVQIHGRTRLSLKKAVLREKETAASSSQDLKLRDAASEN